MILKWINISSQIKNSEDLFRNIKIDFKLRNKLSKKRVLFMNKMGNQIFKKTIYSTKKLLITLKDVNIIYNIQNKIF